MLPHTLRLCVACGLPRRAQNVTYTYIQTMQCGIICLALRRSVNMTKYCHSHQTLPQQNQEELILTVQVCRSCPERRVTCSEIHLNEELWEGIINDLLPPPVNWRYKNGNFSLDLWIWVGFRYSGSIVHSRPVYISTSKACVHFLDLPNELLVFMYKLNKSKAKNFHYFYIVNVLIPQVKFSHGWLPWTAEKTEAISLMTPFSLNDPCPSCVLVTWRDYSSHGWLPWAAEKTEAIYLFDESFFH